MTLTLPWPAPVLSPNARVSRWVKAQAVRSYRARCGELAWAAGINPTISLTPAHVLFSPPSGRWDKDNCIAAFKAGQDGIADALGADDRHFDPAYDLGPPVLGGAVTVSFDIPG